ncbi:MAG: hypothetical protein U9Q67_01090 [Patescibacteria group bacterium]|nr:hypothetical protein [Patescibacteria group bacterium]
MLKLNKETLSKNWGKLILMLAVVILVLINLAFATVILGIGSDDDTLFDAPPYEDGYSNAVVYYEVIRSEPIVINIENDLIESMSKKVDTAFVFDGSFRDYDALIANCLFERSIYGSESIKVGNNEPVVFSDAMPLVGYSVRTESEAEVGKIDTMELMESTELMSVPTGGSVVLYDVLWDGVGLGDMLSANPYSCDWKDWRSVFRMTRDAEGKVMLYVDIDTE